MRVIGQPALRFDADAPPGGSGAVSVHGLPPGWLAFFADHPREGNSLEALFRVAVVPPGGTGDDDLPDVSGRYEVLGDALRFVPRFPFARGVRYRASFCPPRVGSLRRLAAATLEFSLPAQRLTAPAEVAAVYPASDCLPANLLRFYVRFSTPMQRGRVQEHVALLDEDGRPVPDVLYRAPVELWDRSMRHLTILLDPGRLKRGVGPNVALGPPLKVGREYTLAVGAAMLDATGQALREDFRKRFRVAPAVQEPVAVDRWQRALPSAGSREPLKLTFPGPLDWAMLWRSITVESADGAMVGGEIAVGAGETRWSFAPATPWAVGTYRVCVATTLEDVCGNSLVGAFDGPLRASGVSTREATTRSIDFCLE